MNVSALNLNQINEIVIREDSVAFYIPGGYIEFDTNIKFKIRFYFKGRLAIFRTAISLEGFANSHGIPLT